MAFPPGIVYGASFCLGLVLWIIPEIYNYYSKMSRAIFPVDLASTGDDADSIVSEEDDDKDDDNDSRMVGTPPDVESPERSIRKQQIKSDDEGIRKAEPFNSSFRATPTLSPIFQLLHAYINSVLGLDKGVFSGKSYFERLFYEWSVNNTYFSILRPEVNGAYGVLIQKRDNAVVPLSSFEGSQGDASNSQNRMKITLSSGAWNRFIRACRIITNLNVSFTILGLLYFNQYPNISDSSKCANLETLSQCLSEKIVFLDTVSYCAFDAVKRKCAGNTEPALSIQFLVLGTLLAALIMAPFQWIQDVLVDSLMVIPAAEKAAFEPDTASAWGGQGGSLDEEAETDLANSNQDDDYDELTSCPTVDNSRRHRRLQMFFTNMENARNHDALMSSLETGDAANRLIDEADTDIIMKLYSTFPISRIHKLEDRNMKNLVELLALFESVKNWRTQIGAGRERNAFERQWGIVPSTDDPEDFYLIGKSMLVMDDHTTLYDLCLMYVFNTSENYCDVSEMEIRMAEAKKVAQDVMNRLDPLTSHDHERLQGDYRNTLEILRLFAVDYMGGPQCAAARTYLSKTGALQPFSLNPFPVLQTNGGIVGVWMAIISTNIIAIAVGFGVFTLASMGWTTGFIAACCMHTFLDAWVYQSCAAIWSGFIIPDQVYKSVRLSLQLISPTLEYIWRSSQDPMAAAPVGVLAEDVRQTVLCAPKFLYSSRKLSEGLQSTGFASTLVRRFNTAWLMPGLRPISDLVSRREQTAAAMLSYGSSTPSIARSNGDKSHGLASVVPYPMDDEPLPQARARGPRTTSVSVSGNDGEFDNKENEVAFAEAEVAHEDTDELMGMSFGESDSFLRSAVLRAGNWPIGMQRTVINTLQILFALVFGYAAFSTNPNSGTTNAAITYGVLIIPPLLLFIAPYLPLPSCAKLSRMIPCFFGQSKALVAMAEEGDDAAAVEDLMLKALERASRLLDDDEYVLRERRPVIRHSDSVPSIAFTESSTDGEDQSRPSTQQKPSNKIAPENEPEPVPEYVPEPAPAPAPALVPQPQPPVKRAPLPVKVLDSTPKSYLSTPVFGKSKVAPEPASDPVSMTSSTKDKTAVVASNKSLRILLGEDPDKEDTGEWDDGQGLFDYDDPPETDSPVRNLKNDKPKGQDFDDANSMDAPRRLDPSSRDPHVNLESVYQQNLLEQELYTGDPDEWTSDDWNDRIRTRREALRQKKEAGALNGDTDDAAGPDRRSAVERRLDEEIEYRERQERETDQARQAENRAKAESAEQESSELDNIKEENDAGMDHNSSMKQDELDSLLKMRRDLRLQKTMADAETNRLEMEELERKIQRAHFNMRRDSSASSKRQASEEDAQMQAELLAEYEAEEAERVAALKAKQLAAEQTAQSAQNSTTDNHLMAPLFGDSSLASQPTSNQSSNNRPFNQPLATQDHHSSDSSNLQLERDKLQQEAEALRKRTEAARAAAEDHKKEELVQQQREEEEFAQRRAARAAELEAKKQEEEAVRQELIREREQEKQAEAKAKAEAQAEAQAQMEAQAFARSQEQAAQAASAVEGNFTNQSSVGSASEPSYGNSAAPRESQDVDDGWIPPSERKNVHDRNHPDHPDHPDHLKHHPHDDRSHKHHHRSSEKGDHSKREGHSQSKKAAKKGSDEEDEGDDDGEGKGGEGDDDSGSYYSDSDGSDWVSDDEEDEGVVLRSGKYGMSAGAGPPQKAARSAKKTWKMAGKLGMLKEKSIGLSMQEQMRISGEMQEIREEFNGGLKDGAGVPQGRSKKSKKKKMASLIENMKAQIAKEEQEAKDAAASAELAASVAASE